MFSRRKEKQPLSTKLLELYNDIANSSLLYISLEETNRPSELLQGWKSLHTSLLYKLDSLDKEIKTASLTAEEINLLDEIMLLKVRCDDNKDRLQLKMDSIYRTSSNNKSPSNTLASSSRLNVPTLRTKDPHPMKYGQLQKKNKPMMKSLRSQPQKQISHQQSAQKAASLSWNNEDKISNWAPSTSINNQAKSYSTSNITNEFEDFSTFDTTKQLTRNETLLLLEQSGKSSRLNRSGLLDSNKSDDSLDEIEKNFTPILRLNKPQQQQQQPLKKTVSPYQYKQPQIPRFVINKPKPKPHERRERSITRDQQPTRASPSPLKRKPVPKQVELETEEDSTEKETENLENIDSTKLDDEKLIKSLKGVDPMAARQILNEIVVHGDEVHWDDIAGLDGAKTSLKETVVYPFLRPDLFSGLREPARGMLLFGPPGTGKTMLARAVATESKSTFFSISASSLTSKYLGESEKLVRALFQLAKKLAPSIIFVDEIDSLLSSRNNEGENESSRRIKNEFLVQWSDLTKAAAGRDSGEDLQRVLVLAATNLPWAIDEAARRRFVRRQYIPLPEYETRRAQFAKLLGYQKHTLTDLEFDKLVEMTEGYSGSDITALAKDAAMGPLRLLGDKLLLTSKNEIRPIALIDFEASLKFIKPSVSQENLKEFEEWSKLFGSSGT